MNLVVITVSYNTRDLLADCLDSVLEGLQRSGLDSRVWVVDNASMDGSASMVRERFPAVQLVALNANVGFAAANNVALEAMGFWREAKPRHVLFLNPDTRVVGDALGVMVRFLDSTPEAGAAGARLVHSDGSFQHSVFAFPGLAQVFLDFFPLHQRILDSRLNGRYPRRSYEEKSPFAVDHPLGAALAVRAQTLSEVGSFDERFFMYCEEIDLCRRIKGAGWEIYCVPRAEIVHLVGKSTSQFRDEMFVALWKSRFLMFEKYEGDVHRKVLRGMVRCGLWNERRRARAARRRGELSAQELESRLAAYSRVAAL